MALVQTKAQNGGGYVNSNAVAFTSSVTAGSLLICAITAGAADTVASVVDNKSQTWTLIGSDLVTGARQTWLYYSKNAGAGATTVTVTYGASQYTDNIVILREYSGMDTTAPLDVYATGHDGGYVQVHSSAATATLANAIELAVVAGGGDAASPTWAAGTGFGNALGQAGFDAYTSGAIEDKTTSTTAAVTGTLQTTSYIQGQAITAMFKFATSNTTTDRTQTGVARITATTLRTQTGVSKINITTDRTQTGITRVTATTLRTQTGVSNISSAIVTTSQTQTGVARINGITLRTQTGVANIKATTDRTQTGLSRITKTVDQTQTGISRINGITLRTQTGVSRITAATLRTQTGKANIVIAVGIPTQVNVAQGDTQLLISWNDSASSSATSYSVTRSTTSGGTYTQVGTPTGTEYLDTGLTNGTTYYYKVAAVNAGGTGTYTAYTSGTPAARPSTPSDKWYKYGAAPSGVTQTNVRTYTRTHYDNWVSYTFTKTGASLAGKGAWRVQAPDQDFQSDGDHNATVSEGIGYGMFVTAFMSNWYNPMYDINAQKYFNGMWLYYKNYMDSNGLMNWHISSTGTVAGTGGATDGDVDVAVSLVIMHLLHGSSGAVNYLSEAQTLINNIRDYEFVPTSNGTTAWRNLMMNGDTWGVNTDRYMPDYFAPAWMRLFKYATGDARWDDIIAANYSIAVDYFYNNTPYGLVPDGSTRAGASNGSEGYTYGYNSIRMPWRLSADYLWNGNTKAYNSINRLGTDVKARFSNTPSSAKANPALDWSTYDNYINQVYLSGYGIAGTVNATNADWAGNVISWLNTNTSNEASYFGASLGMVALLSMSGEMQPFFADQNQTGVAKINKESLKTQTGVARILSGTTQDQTGKSRITASTLQTTTGTARITAQVTQNVTGKSRITQTVNQSQTGISRVAKVVDATQTGKGSISKLADQTILGLSRITATTLRTQTGTSRITVTTDRTQTGKSNITTVNLMTQTGLSRVTATTLRTQTGVANITATPQTMQTQTGKAAISKTVDRTQAGITRMSRTTDGGVRSIEFTASSYILSATNPIDAVTNTQVSYTFKFKMTGPETVTNRQIFNASSNRLDFNIETGSNLPFVWFTDSTGTGHLVWKAGVSYNDGITHRVAVNKTATAIDVWVDGVNVGSYATTDHVQATSSVLNIGNGPVRMSQVATYNRSMSSGELTALFNNGTIPASPTLYWPLSETHGTVANDLSGNGLNGSIGGNPTFINDPLTGTSRISTVVDKTQTGVARITNYGFGPNLIRNGDFSSVPAFVAAQTGNNGYRYVDGTALGSSTDLGYRWASGSIGTSSVNFDTVTKRGSFNSFHIQIVSTGQAVEVRGDLSGQTYNTPVGEGFVLKPNTNYRMSVWIKAANVAGSALTGAQLAVLPADSSGNAQSTWSVGSITANQGWTFYSSTFTTGSTYIRGHAEIRVYGHNGAGTLTGDFYFAEASFVEEGGNLQGISRIQKIVDKTQTGVGRIQQTVDRTQTGTSRITKIVDAIQTGLARITAQTLRTQTGTSRVTVTTDRAQTGVARLTNGVNQNQLGTSRITRIIDANQTGISRIINTSLRTITGLSRIQQTVNATQLGTARVTRTMDQTQTGVARVQKTGLQNILGVTRITRVMDSILTGVARITNTLLRTQTGVSRIQLITLKTQLGTSRITRVMDLTQTGKSRITQVIDSSLTGTSRITRIMTQNQTGRSFITLDRIKNQTGVARIVSPHPYPYHKGGKPYSDRTSPYGKKQRPYTPYGQAYY